MSSALVPLQGEALLGHVDQLIERIGENFFDLGAALFEIKAGEVYKDREHGSWEVYCDSALPFQFRKADHYIELWELYCQKLGFDYDEIKHVGWSKLVKVKGMIETKADAKKWIGRCEKHGRRAIETMVKQEYARRRAANPTGDTPTYERIDHDTDGELQGAHVGTNLPAVDPSVLQHEELTFEDPETGETVPLHQFQVYLFQDQWANVMAAMNRAGQLSNSDKSCYLLDLIATEFNTTYVETADGGVAQKLEYVIKNLERVFDVKISVEVAGNSRLRHMSRLDEKPTKAKKKVRKLKKTAAKKKPEKKSSPPHAW